MGEQIVVVVLLTLLVAALIALDIGRSHKNSGSEEREP